jgi:hypothetical protein
LSTVTFPAFVYTLDAALRAALGGAGSVVFDEQLDWATWTRGPFKASVERHDLSVRASIALNGTVGREFHDPLTEESARRLAIEFAALLSAGED